MKRLVLALALALAACAPSAAQTEAWSPIELTVTPFEMPEEVGRLRFVAGFELESPQARFGGLSDLHVFEDGRLLAITDSGEWFLAELTFDAETGVPTGLVNPRMALMRDEAGEPFPDKESGDAEDLAVLPDGRVAVSFEQTQSIRIYDLFGAGPLAPAQTGPALSGTERLNSNRGLEALAVLGSGELLVGAEMGRRAGPLPIWRVALDAPTSTPPDYALRVPLGFGLTSFAASDNDGALWAAQRFYAPGLGTRIRILRGAPPSEPGALILVEVSVLAAPLTVDNVEGIAVRARVGVVEQLFLLSDDNFNEDQRTLLYVFEPAAP